MTVHRSGNEEVCGLCGIPLKGRSEATGEFCCSGCERVFEILSHLDESAHSSYLKTARELGLIPDTKAPPPEPIKRELPKDPDAMREERFALSGMVCPSCAWIVEKILDSSEGVESARVDYFSGTANVSFDLRLNSPQGLADQLSPLGYSINQVTETEKGAFSRRVTVEFIIAAVLTMNLMSLSFLRYAEGLGLMDTVPEFLVWLEMILALPVLYIGWIPIVRRAVTGLAVRKLTMDLLLGIAVFAAFALSIAALLTGRDDIYFETCAGLVTISLLSQMIEAKLRDRAFRDLAPLLKMRIRKVRKIQGNKENYVDIENISPGDRILFLPGETLPFDGESKGQTAFVSEAVLTGEPTPKRKVNGDAVVAGSSVVEGRLEIEIVRRYDETRLAEIASAVSNSLVHAENRLRSADRITAWFVPLVLFVSAGIWLARLAALGFDYAISADGWFPSVAVLAVACPCAFSLAGISAVTAATGNLLKHGMLVKEPVQLDALANTDCVIFDKTGTVTEGEMEVDKLVWRGDHDEFMLTNTLIAERGSNHPVAGAIRSYLLERNATDLGDTAAAVEDLPGQGRRTELSNGKFSIGSASLFEDLFEPEEMTIRHTSVWFGLDGRASGCFLITDKIKTDAESAIGEIKALGLNVELISGDRQAVTDHVAGEIGINDATGDVTTDEKVDIVKNHIQKKNKVAFVGDGTNDAMAMAESGVSVALAKSTDEALAASGFVVLKGNLKSVPKLFKIGRKLARVIRANYVWAFAFNTLFIPVAALGYLVPLAAMLLMLLSSTAVLLNSLRLRNQQESSKTRHKPHKKLL